MATHPRQPTSMSGNPAVPAKARWARLAMIAIAFIGLYVLGRFIADMVAGQFDLVMHVRSEPIIHRMIMTASAVYVGLMAMPFMPGVEIGISMIMVLGPKIAFLIYVLTVIALIPPYLVGRFVPLRYCLRVLEFLGLHRLHALMAKTAPLSVEERFAYLVNSTPSRVMPFILRHRFVALALVINLPGNIMIGGGGGIALMAGLTGLYPFPAYLLTVAVAVAPVPLALMLTDLVF